MDFLHETVALGVDLLIMGLCVKEYVQYKSHLKSLKSAPQLTIDGDLKDYVARQKDKKVPYAAVRGTVTALGGEPLRSVLSPSVTGVIQVIRLSEHRVQRGVAGFWTEQHKLIHVSSNEMPFALCQHGTCVQVIDALSAEMLDLDVVYDNYEPSDLSITDHVFGFFSGIRQKGLETTEEVLRTGSFITAIGELELEGQTLRIQPSPSGPLFLTTATKATLIKKFEEFKSSALVKVVICGAISAVIVGLIARKFYLKRCRERDERKIKETIEQERRLRRAQSRPQSTPADQLCVVCSTNPKEVIILPCGHVCLCEDCSEKIKVTCPVCRGKIVRRAAAFIT